MSHFADEVWADLARGSLPADETAAVADHVAAGCAECSLAMRTWEQLTEILHREASYAPPVELVEQAQSLLPPGRVTEAGARGRRIATLVFDSFSNPLPVGMRAIERSTRQLCFKTGSFYVDLRIEEHPGTTKASVLGQLIRVPYDERIRLEGLDVTLSSGDVSLSNTTTNRLGEFQLEVPTEGQHNIALGIGEGFAMVIPLRSLRRRGH